MEKRSVTSKAMMISGAFAISMFFANAAGAVGDTSLVDSRVGEVKERVRTGKLESLKELTGMTRAAEPVVLPDTKPSSAGVGIRLAEGDDGCRWHPVTGRRTCGLKYEPPTGAPGPAKTRVAMED